MLSPDHRQLFMHGIASELPRPELDEALTEEVRKEFAFQDMDLD